MDWGKFDEIFNVEEIKEDIQESASQFDSIPAGIYPMQIESMVLKESKKGDPMFAARFRITEDAESQGNRVLFYNQVVTQGWQLNMVLKFLKDLVDEGLKDSIDFTSFNQFGTMVQGLEAEATTMYEYDIEVSYGKKDTEMNYPRYKVVKLYNVG